MNTKPDRPCHNFRASSSGDRRFFVVQERCPKDFKASKLWKGRLGKPFPLLYYTIIKIERTIFVIEKSWRFYHLTSRKNEFDHSHAIVCQSFQYEKQHLRISQILTIFHIVASLVLFCESTISGPKRKRPFLYSTVLNAATTFQPGYVPSKLKETWISHSDQNFLNDRGSKSADQLF